jgi:hypothetical protein
VDFKLYNKANFILGPFLKSLPCVSHNAGREIIWNIGPENEYKTQSPVIPFVGIIIRKNMSSDNNVTSCLLAGVLRQRGKGNFKRQLNVLLTVLSLISKIFQPQSAYENIYFILRPYFFQNKYDPHTNNSRPPHTTNSLPPGALPHSFGTSDV